MLHCHHGHARIFTRDTGRFPVFSNGKHEGSQGLAPKFGSLTRLPRLSSLDNRERTKLSSATIGKDCHTMRIYIPSRLPMLHTRNLRQTKSLRYP
jgi:hypothetical protein